MPSNEASSLQQDLRDAPHLRGLVRAMKASRLRWITIAGPMAWCSHCSAETGGVYHGDNDRDSRKAIAWARRHAAETGHGVIIERGQSMHVAPAAALPGEERRA